MGGRHERVGLARLRRGYLSGRDVFPFQMGRYIQGNARIVRDLCLNVRGPYRRD